jgi:hypothetical protein
MKKNVHLYVEFQSPGLLFAEMWDREVKSIDPNAVKWPDNAYAFRMFKREDIEEGGQTYTGTRQQIGPTYYHPDSRVETLAEVEARGDPNEKILISNMKGNKWNAIVWTRWNNFPQPYDEKDSTILPNNLALLKAISREALRMAQ